MGDAAELDFHHRLRLDPYDILAALVLGHLDWRLAGPQRVEPLPQVARRGVRVTSANAPGVAKFAVLMKRHRQGADRARHGARRAEADGHDFLLVVALG